MEENYLKLCSEYLNKLKILLEKKKVEDLQFRDYFQIILDMEKASIKTLDYLPDCRGKPITLNDYLHREIMRINKNKKENLVTIQTQFLQPIDQCISDSYFDIQNMIQTLVNSVNQTREQYGKLDRSKIGYYQIYQQYQISKQREKESLKDLQAGIINEEEYLQVQNSQKSTYDLLIKNEKQYKSEIELLNSSLTKITEIMKPYLDQISSFYGKKNALLFIKLEQFQKIKEYFGKDGNPTDKILNHYTQQKLQFLQSQNKDQLLIEMFEKFQINLNLTTQEYHKVEFISYEKQQQMENEQIQTGGFIFIENDQTLTHEEKIKIESIFSTMTKDKEYQDSFDMDSLEILFSKISAIQEFLDEFIKKVRKVNNRIVFDQNTGLFLAKVFDIIIDELFKMDYIDSESIFKLLKLFERVEYKEGKQQKKYFQYFEKSLLWKKVDIWKSLYKLLWQRQDKTEKKEKFNIINVFGNIKKKVLGLEDNKQEEIEKSVAIDLQKKTIIEILIKYLKQLRKGISLELGKEIIQELARYHQLPAKITVELFDDFEDDYVFSTIKNLTYSTDDKQKLYQIWGKQIVFKNAFQYLQFKEKSRIVMVNKFLNERLQKQLLIDFSYNGNMNWPNRIQVWSQILNIKDKNTPFLSQVHVKQDSIEQGLAHIIRMDVKRSFTEDKNFPRQDLLEILFAQTYLMNDTIGYCQGMNYLAGFFLKYIQNKEYAFKLYYKTLLTKVDLFDSKFEKLQGYFYVIDKLIKVHIPKLSKHFEEIKISVSFVASSWLITIFTNCLQYTNDSYLVQYIMDTFIAENYLGLFKSIIAILLHLERPLLKLSFEYCLEFFSNLPKHEIFVNSKYRNYLKLKEQKLNMIQIKKQCGQLTEDYEFVYQFKQKCQELKINRAFVVFFESRYREVSCKINQFNYK